MSSIVKIRGGGEPFRFAWSSYSKIQQFPFKFYWKNARFFRYYFYTAILLTPLYAFLDKASNSPGNVKQWEEIRAKRHHTYFELPHD